MDIPQVKSSNFFGQGEKSPNKLLTQTTHIYTNIYVSVNFGGVVRRKNIYKKFDMINI